MSAGQLPKMVRRTSTLQAVVSPLVGLLAWLAIGSTTLLAQQNIPDIRSVDPDLEIPEIWDGPPAAGKRVKLRFAAADETALYHVLYLPSDYQAGDKYPVLVEFSGNGGYKSAYGDVSDGVPEGSQLGYGMSGGKGFIWLCLPFVDDHQQVATRWWGSAPNYQSAPTLSYAQRAVATICRDYGGDSSKVILCGFSRGAIACNFIGLHDDAIARLWCGFVAYSHYDGVQKWPYPGCDEAAALSRLQRLGDRPQFILHEGTDAADGGLAKTREYLTKTGVSGNFQFAVTGFRNHNDAWALRDCDARSQLRAWLRELVEQDGCNRLSE